MKDKRIFEAIGGGEGGHPGRNGNKKMVSL